MSFQKISRKKKFVGKFDFITGGWVGPDVLLGEWICLLTSLLTNESPPWENKDQITTIPTDKDKSNKVKKFFFFSDIFEKHNIWKHWNKHQQNLPVVLLRVKHCKTIPTLTNMHILLTLRGIAIKSNPEISPTLFITYHTVSLCIRENWDMDSCKFLWGGRGWFHHGILWWTTIIG